ncbi:hypothetical protein QWA68_000277, partial [Fusarium oxysporum]
VGRTYLARGFPLQCSFPPYHAPRPGQVLPITFSLLLCFALLSATNFTKPYLPFHLHLHLHFHFPWPLTTDPFFFSFTHPFQPSSPSEYPPDCRSSHSCLRTEPLRKLRLSFIDSSPTLRKSYPTSDRILVAVNQGQATIAYRCYNMEMGIGRINQVMDDAPLDSFFSTYSRASSP